MDINYVFCASRRIVISNEHHIDYITCNTRVVGQGLFYIKSNKGIDLYTKEKLSVSCSKLNIGQQFIDMENNFYPFTDCIAEINKTLMKNIVLEPNMSRRQIFKILEEIKDELELKNQEKEKVKKLIRINEYGGKK